MLSSVNGETILKDNVNIIVKERRYRGVDCKLVISIARHAVEVLCTLSLRKRSSVEMPN
jgi:hypothetical protein